MILLAAAEGGSSGTAVFVLIVLLAGSLAAGLFVATPLRARLDGRRRSTARPWSTAVAPADDSIPSGRSSQADKQADAELWSTEDERVLKDGR